MRLRRRLERDPVLKKYLASIDDYVEKGYAHKLTPEETKVRSNKTWYLPHHPVLNPRKPGKVPAVFDAASTFAGTSLNEELLQGPDLINNLVGVLVRFRQDSVTLITDIESMFHQVRVIPEDTDALQFLWTDGDLQKPPEEYKMLVRIFGAKSSPCCANRALKESANDNEAKYSKLVADVVQRNFYMDNLLKSTTTVEQAIDLSLKLISLLQELYFQSCIANATTHTQYISPAYYPTCPVNGSYYLTSSVNVPCGRKPEHPEKTHVFQQSVDYFLFTLQAHALAHCNLLKLMLSWSILSNIFSFSQVPPNATF